MARLARLLVLVGQLALLIAVGMDGNRGPSAAPHVERSGIDLHYAHNEATCVACTVLSLHARHETPYNAAPVFALRSDDAPTGAPTTVNARKYARDNPARAPPIAS